MLRSSSPVKSPVVAALSLNWLVSGLIRGCVVHNTSIKLIASIAKGNTMQQGVKYGAWTHVMHEMRGGIMLGC
eukprot:5788390-Ditylum_brightwellii.AAC.1